MASKHWFGGIAAVALAAAGAVAGCGGGDAAPVKATLSDGQVMYGDLRTSVLVLDSEIGRLEIPLVDVGEVVPVEGTEMDDADGYVRVWLRNGSELVGRWDDPQLAMDIAVGGDDVKVDLPVPELHRLQTQGGELWPDAAVYRVRTTTGDDFLVDADESRIAIENDLGKFRPYLSECRTVRPVDDPDGDWRIELETGTVLVGRPVDDALTLVMPLGPAEVTVPLAVLESMQVQSWYIAAPTAPTESERRPGRFGRADSRDEPRAKKATEKDGATGWNPWKGGSGGMASPSVAEPALAEEISVDSATSGPTPWLETAAAEDQIAADPAPPADGEGYFSRGALEQSKNQAETP
jgi:hypothetical protein